MVKLYINQIIFNVLYNLVSINPSCVCQFYIFVNLKLSENVLGKMISCMKKILKVLITHYRNDRKT